MKFSVIIPVYKVEKYLGRCVDSILNQDYSDYEIILIDDGSPDQCPIICDEYTSKYEKIFTIHKINEGLGLARNTGIEEAHGDYLMFVDSDDYIEPNALSILAYELEKNGKPDICAFGYKQINFLGEITSESNTISKYFDQKEIQKTLLPRAFSYSLRKPYDQYGIGSAWGAVYRKDFLNQNRIRFLSEREYLSEDLLFSVEICLHAKTALLIDEKLYCYCENGASLSHSYREDRFNKSLYLYEYMNDIICKEKLNNNAKNRAQDGLLINCIVCLKQEVQSEKKYFSKREEIKKILNNPQIIKTLKEYPLSKLDVKKKILFGCVKLKLVDIVYLIVRLKIKS